MGRFGHRLVAVTGGEPRALRRGDLLLSYAAPVSNEQVPLGLRQQIAANEPLRTGLYSKTLTFTLSTTNP